ncbi:hypothetical protein BBJ28_00025551 [Nothophytophthora sp. Chile5]|nr:hypothetical protein BBJ28_00025551 [Nothophytophthora sp. Chile5]
MSDRPRLPPDKPPDDEIVPDSQESEADRPSEWEIVPETESSDTASVDDELSGELLLLSVSSSVNRKKATSTRKKKQTKKVTPKSKREQTRIAPNPERKKSLGTVLEKAFKKGKTFSNVVCRLASICSDPLLLEEIKRSALAMKQVQMEAWHLVNLHTLRCLENNLPLPDFGATFFDQCCSGVASTTRTHLIAQKNPSLWNSIQIYRDERAHVDLAEVPNLTGYTELKSQLRQQMVVNAGVMIREHFRKRLRAYVEITFGQTEGELTKKKKQERKTRLGQIMYACYNVQDTDLPEALQMRDMLTPADVEWSDQWIPWPSHIKKNGMEFYVRLIWKFQNVVEERMEEVPNEKGIRAFSLFPISTSYMSAHITLNGSTLAGFYARIRKGGSESVLDRWRLPGISLKTSSFQQNRWTVIRRAFDIARFETRNADCPLTKPEFVELTVEEKYEHASRLFANQVTTNGYGASVLLFRPKADASEEDEEEDEEEEKKKEKEEKEDVPVVPRGYVPNMVIGLDPGMRALCTAVREDFRPEERRGRRTRRRRRSRQRRTGKTKRRKRDRPHWIRRHKAPRHRNDRDIVSVTSREYRHMAGFNRGRSWNEGQRKLHPDYQKAIAGMPSFKTAKFELYLERLEYFWRNASFLLDFCLERPFLKWKFFQKRMARVAVDEIARRIVPIVSKQMCVAYGDWSRRNGIKGHAPSPVKGLEEALQKRATVVSMDEFKTSKLCSQCHQPLSIVRYAIDQKLPKRRTRKGVVLARNRAEVQFEVKKCHAVLRCDHEKCDARYWDRVTGPSQSTMHRGSASDILSL